MPNQIIQIAGSLLILVPFIFSIRGYLHVRGRYYLASNLIGSATLAVDAAFGRQWGFLLLEAVWAIVSAATIVKIAIAGDTAGAAGHTTQESQAPVGR